MLAAINSDGSPLSQIQLMFLPNSEKAICIGCCDTFVIALSSSGRVYESKLTIDTKSTFSEVFELKGFKFIDVSGAYTHCLAVTNDGRVFGRGSNLSGQLGLGKEIEKSVVFLSVSMVSSEIY